MSHTYNKRGISIKNRLRVPSSVCQNIKTGQISLRKEIRMGLEEKVLTSGIAMITAGVSGVLSLIPALQEISLDKKLNEEKMGLETGAYRPDLVARHIRKRGAVFIGCNNEAMMRLREEFVARSIPFVTVETSSIEDEAKRSNFFFTIVVRDVNAKEVIEIVNRLTKEMEQDDQNLEEELNEEIQDTEEDLEEDLEREIGEKEQVLSDEEEEILTESFDEEEEFEEDEEDDEKKKKKKKKKSSSQDKIKDRRKYDQDQKDAEQKSEEQKKTDHERHAFHDSDRKTNGTPAVWAGTRDNTSRSRESSYVIEKDHNFERSGYSSDSGESSRKNANTPYKDTYYGETYTKEKDAAEHHHENQGSTGYTQIDKTEKVSYPKEEHEQTPDSVRKKEPAGYTSAHSKKENDNLQESHKNDTKRYEENKSVHSKVFTDVKKAEQKSVATSSEYTMHAVSKNYRDAHAIRVEEIEAQCRRYSELESLRRSLELDKLHGTQGDDYYKKLKELRYSQAGAKAIDADAARVRYRELSESIKAHDDRFRSVAQSGWREFSEQAMRNAKEATLTELHNGNWDIPSVEDYLRKTPEGTFSSYTREEKQQYFDQKYANGSKNIDYHEYVSESAKCEVLKRQDELVRVRAQYGPENPYYKEKLTQYNIKDKDIAPLNPETVLKQYEQKIESCKKLERDLKSGSYIGFSVFKDDLHHAIQRTDSLTLTSKDLVYAPNPAAYMKTQDGKTAEDFRGAKFSKEAYDRLYSVDQVRTYNAPKAETIRVEAGNVSLKRIATGSDLKSLTTQSYSKRSTYGGILTASGVSVIENGSFSGNPELRRYEPRKINIGTVSGHTLNTRNSAGMQPVYENGTMSGFEHRMGSEISDPTKISHDRKIITIPKPQATEMAPGTETFIPNIQSTTGQEQILPGTDSIKGQTPFDGINIRQQQAIKHNSQNIEGIFNPDPAGIGPLGKIDENGLETDKISRRNVTASGTDGARYVSIPRQMISGGQGLSGHQGQANDDQNRVNIVSRKVADPAKVVFINGTKKANITAQMVSNQNTSEHRTLHFDPENPEFQKAVKAATAGFDFKSDWAQVRGRHALIHASKNRMFLQIVKEGGRTAVSTMFDGTEAGAAIRNVTDMTRLPAHLVKQQILNSGAEAIVQGTQAMTALENQLIAARVTSIMECKSSEDLERFARKLDISVDELITIKADKKDVLHLVTKKYHNTGGKLDPDDMAFMINHLGIRGNLEKDDLIGREDVLNFLKRNGETTLAQRDRALSGMLDELQNLSRDQQAMLTAMFSKEAFFNHEEMTKVLKSNGLSEELVETLTGSNWLKTDDIALALKQANFSDDNITRILMQIGKISTDDRTAMIGMYQVLSGDGVNGFRELLEVLNVGDDLKEELLLNYMRFDHLSLSDIKKLMKTHGNNKESMLFLESLYAQKRKMIVANNRKFSKMDLFNAMQGALTRLGRGTDAIAGLNQILTITRAITRVTKSGYKLLYNVVLRRVKPFQLGKLKVNPASMTGASIKNAISSKATKRMESMFSEKIVRKTESLFRISEKIGKPFRHMTHVMSNKVEAFLVKRGVDTAALRAAASSASSKFASIAATVSEAAMTAAVVILIVLAVLMIYESIEIEEKELEQDNKGAEMVYVSAADGPNAFAQEVIDMLQGYTNEFVDDINNAQYNRNIFANMAGFNTNEHVDAYENGAFQIVFRGPDGEPINDITSVDLNNSKDIISMASVFIPTIFEHPGNNASSSRIAEYERDKEHFKDYCTFLWAASHQIAFEEYHLGHADENNPDIIDNSGMMTDATTGKCQMDYELFGDQGTGVNWYNGTGVSPVGGKVCRICRYYWSDTSIRAPYCCEQPAANPCTNGHWKTYTDTSSVHKGCNGHTRYDRDEQGQIIGSYDEYCSESWGSWCNEETTHKRVWVCDGHMGGIVYVTIGRISRIPDFGDPTDYDFDNPQSFGGTGIFDYTNGS